MKTPLTALTLKSKTRLISAILLVCFLSVGVLAVNRLSVVSHQSAVVSQFWTPRAALAEQLNEAASAYRISEALRILSVTPDMAEHADSDVKENADLFQSKLASYRKLLLRGEDAAAVNNISELWLGYVAGNEQMLAYAKDGKTADATDRFRNSASKFYLVTDALSKLSDDNVARGARASATAAEIYKQSRLLVIVAMGFIAALMILAATFMEFKVWRALVQMSAMMQRLARGDFEAEISGSERKDEVGEMARAVQVFKDNGLEVRRLEAETEAQRHLAEEDRRKGDESLAAVDAQRTLVVTSVASGLAALSRGDLTFRLDETFAPEFRQLQDDFNAAMADLQETMKVISTGALGINSGTEEISQASDRLARRTEKQAASLEETAAALEQLTNTVRTSAESAKQAKQSVSTAKTNAEQSAEVVQNAVAAMSEIERSARQISEIIGVMDEIAFQTNLLALNAGVEAARAGEAGKGFAVVASEVRALAQRSTVAAKEIKALISSSTQQVGAGVSLVGETGKALERIAGQVGEINKAIGDIAVASEDQASGLLQISGAVSQMDKVTQQNAAMAEESTAASHNLAQEARELANLIGKFRVGATPVASAGHAPRDERAYGGSQGHAVLRTMSSGNAAMAARLETAIASEGWEEF